MEYPELEKERKLSFGPQPSYGGFESVSNLSYPTQFVTKSNDSLESNKSHVLKGSIKEKRKQSLFRFGEANFSGKQTFSQGNVPDRGNIKDMDPSYLTLGSISTVHGLDKVITSISSPERRWIWLLLILASLCVFAYQATLRLMYYMERPVTMNYLVVNNQSIMFPVVVICNQNAFRLTAAAQNGWYKMLDDMYSRENISTFNPDEYGAGNISLEYLFTRTAHRKENLIAGCEWNKKKCSTNDFDITYTDYGICYTFNGPGSNRRQLTYTGAGNGLSLNLNIEQYEYMKGPHRAAGLKILLYGHNEAPFVDDLGDALPTGMDAFISVDAELATSLPKPHGTCKPMSNYSQSICLERCRTTYATKMCRCRHFYMKETKPGYPPICNLKQFTTCLWEAIEAFNVKENCDCPTACESCVFHTAITYASTPTQNVFTGTLNDTALAESYLLARETAQKSFPSIIQEDTTLVHSVFNTFIQVEEAMYNVLTALHNLDQGKVKLLEDIQPRIWFHYNWGLERVEYTMQNNFVRLWDVMDERTFAHVMTGFYQATALFNDMVNKSLDPDAQPSKREIWYEMTERDLLNRIHLCRRAYDNLTILDQGFSYGIPAFRFVISPKRHYDEKYIPFDILSKTPDKKKYFDQWSGYLESALQQLDILRDINNEVFINMTYDAVKMETAMSTYEQRGRNHLYYRYMYHSRIVLPTLQLTKDRTAGFQKINETMFAAVTLLENSFQNIRMLVEDFNETSGVNIAKGVEIAQRYLDDEAPKKYTVARFVNQKSIMRDLTSFQTLFKDLRTRALQILDNWAQFERSYVDLYGWMVNEPWTLSFYEAIYEDMSIYAHNSSEDLKAIWEKMLGYPIDNISNPDFVRQTNADFHGLNFFELEQQLKANFRALIDSNNIVYIIGENAEHFLKAFETMQTVLANYLETTALDTKFYSDNFLRMNIYIKELKYSHMIYQPAYDIVAFLSDIGGTLSLCIGASAITVFEVFDAVILHIIRTWTKKK